MSKKLKIIKEESLLTTPLKKNIRWTPQKLIMAGIITLIPYSAIIYYVISSGMPTGAVVTMVAVPIVMVGSYYFIYNWSRNL